MAKSMESMAESELAELAAWEVEHVDGNGRYGTSDWPGWAERIGPRPPRNISPYEQLARRLHVTGDMLDLITAGEVMGFLAVEAPDGGMMFLTPVGVQRTPAQPFSSRQWHASAARLSRPSPTSPARAAAPPREPQTFTLYRLYGAADRLLYVGITRQLSNRMRAHRRKWGAAIERFTTEEYDDLATLIEAERAAIRDERPALNIDGVDEL